MKKSILAIALGLIAFNPIFGQTETEADPEIEEVDPNKIPFLDRKVVNYVAGSTDIHNGSAVSIGFSIRSLEKAVPFFKDLDLGVIFGNKITAGAEFGFNPVKKSFGHYGNIIFSQRLGLAFYWKQATFVAHDSLMRETFLGRPQDKLTLTLQLGPQMEFWHRVRLAVTFNPGVSWYGHNYDLRYYFSGNLRLVYFWGGVKKMAPLKNPNRWRVYGE